MSIEVACPKCQSRLKAPEGMAGKKARCKKCQHGFVIPGGSPEPAFNAEETQQLSVADEMPFAFDGPPTPTPATDPTPAPTPTKPKSVAKKVAPAADGSNPFAVPSSLPAEEPAEAKSKSKYKTKAATPEAKASKYGAKGKAASGGGKGRGLLFAIAGLLCAGGGGAAFYAYTEYQKSKEQPVAPPVAQANAGEQAAAPPPAEKAADKSKDDKSARKGKTEPTGAYAKGDDATKAPTAPAKRTGPKVTGGMKLPPPAAAPMPFDKAIGVIPLEHDAAAVKQLLTGGAEGPVMLVIRRKDNGLFGKGVTDTIDRYALNGLRLIDKTDVPADAAKTYPRVCDVSPGGDRFLCEHPAGKLSVLPLDGKGMPLVDGLDLAGGGDDAKDPKKAPAGPGIAGLYFLGEDKAAVVLKTGVVEAWDLAAKKKIGESEPLPNVGPLIDKRSMAFRPDRDPSKASVFAFAGGAVYEIPLGGKPRVAVTLSRQPKECLALAVENGGQRIAVAFRATTMPGEHIRFLYGRVGDPDPTGDQPLDPEAGTPIAAAWTRPETFSILTDKNLGFAYDADTNDLIAAFRPAKPAPMVVMDGVKHWFLLADPADAKKSMLVNVTLPPESYAPSLTGEKWKPLSLTVTPAGTAK